VLWLHLSLDGLLRVALVGEWIAGRVALQRAERRAAAIRRSAAAALSQCSALRDFWQKEEVHEAARVKNEATTLKIHDHSTTTQQQHRAAATRRQYPSPGKPITAQNAICTIDDVICNKENAGMLTAADRSITLLCVRCCS